ncbi:MAG: response regulator transcription factor [Bacteroidales bacterium]|nr:response regulator transcription factor [Bacteroidales bacterium]
MNYPNVLIVDDDFLSSEFVRIVLERYDFTVSGVAATPQKALTIFSKGDTDLIICDIDLKCELTGIDVVRKAKKIRPVHVIYLTGMSDEKIFDKALQTQPDAYITKPFTHAQLIATVRTVLNEAELNRNSESCPVPTRREIEIIEQLAKGLTSTQIASELNISFETVQTHRKRILNKFKVNSSSEIIVLAMKKRWINLKYSEPSLF